MKVNKRMVAVLVSTSVSAIEPPRTLRLGFRFSF